MIFIVSFIFRKYCTKTSNIMFCCALFSVPDFYGILLFLVFFYLERCIFYNNVGRNRFIA